MNVIRFTNVNGRKLRVEENGNFFFSIFFCDSVASAMDVIFSDWLDLLIKYFDLCFVFYAFSFLFQDKYDGLLFVSCQMFCKDY